MFREEEFVDEILAVCVCAIVALLAASFLG